MPHARTKRELREIAASADPLPQRAESALDTIGRAFNFDAAWLALADPMTLSLITVGSADLAQSTLDYLDSPATAREIEENGGNRARWPMSPSDRPSPIDELAVWAECLIPAGYREALGVALFAPGGRQVGLLALLSANGEPPAQTTRRGLSRLTSVLADGLDPMRSLRTVARLVEGATAGVVLRADLRSQSLPGLAGDALLASDSALMVCARETIRTGNTYASFLWPLGGRQAPEGHVRVTVFAANADMPSVLIGLVVLSPVSDARGLTPRQLEVLGLLIEGLSNQEIALVLRLSKRTVAAHLEHILVKLDAPTRTLAAVRAEREGVYVPVQEPHGHNLGGSHEDRHDI